MNAPTIAGQGIMAGRYIGQRTLRKEDPRLITGTATYVEDVKLPDMYHAAILRSPHGAANIKSLDISKAVALPGVVRTPSLTTKVKWTDVAAFGTGVKVQVPLPLSTREPLPAEMARLLATSVLLSISPALPSSWAWVMTRAPLSSAMAASVTALVVGTSLTGVMSRLALPATVALP